MPNSIFVHEDQLDALIVALQKQRDFVNKAKEQGARWSTRVPLFLRLDAADNNQTIEIHDAQTGITHARIIRPKQTQRQTPAEMLVDLIRKVVLARPELLDGIELEWEIKALAERFVAEVNRQTEVEIATAVREAIKVVTGVSS